MHTWKKIGDYKAETGVHAVRYIRERGTVIRSPSLRIAQGFQGAGHQYRQSCPRKSKYVPAPISLTSSEGMLHSLKEDWETILHSVLVHVLAVVCSSICSAVPK